MCHLDSTTTCTTDLFHSLFKFHSFCNNRKVSGSKECLQEYHKVIRYNYTTTYFELQHILCLPWCCYVPAHNIFPRNSTKGSMQGHVMIHELKDLIIHHHKRAVYVNQSKLNLHSVLHQHHIFSFQIRRRKGSMHEKKKPCNFCSFQVCQICI